MESEVRRLVSLVEQHEQQMATLNTDSSRRLQEERSRWESKQVDLFSRSVVLLKRCLCFCFGNSHTARLLDQQTLIKGF
jgi:hypothetical protein